MGRGNKAQMQEFGRIGAALFAVAFCAVVQADVLNYDATKVHLVAQAKNQRYTGNAYNKPLVQVWNERSGVVLPVPIAVDIAGPGVYRYLTDLGTYAIPAGTHIDSSFIYYDPGPRTVLETTITFTGRILGVIVTSDRKGDDRLLKTDALALPTVPARNFAQRHFNNRGMEMPLNRIFVPKGTHEDAIAIDGNTLTISLGASSPGDQIRVITESSH